MPLTSAACADSKMSNGITMYETSLFDNKLNSAPSQSPCGSVDCAGSVTRQRITHAVSAISVDPSFRGQQHRQRADKFVKLSARRSDNLTGGEVGERGPRGAGRRTSAAQCV